jgi:ligand-binding sensor protein
MKAKPEWKEKQQEEFSKRLKVETKKQEWRGKEISKLCHFVAPISS